MPRLSIQIHVSTSGSLRAAADLVVIAIDDGQLHSTGAMIQRHRDGMAYVIRREVDRIEVRESPGLHVVGGSGGS